MNTDIRANGADHLTSTNTEPIDVLNESIGKNSARDITRFSSLDPNLMIEIGRNKSLKLFHEASERVPAY